MTIMEGQKGDLPFLFHGFDHESSAVEVEAVVKVAPVTNPTTHFPFAESLKTWPRRERRGLGGFDTKIVYPDS